MLFHGSHLPKEGLVERNHAYAVLRLMFNFKFELFRMCTSPRKVDHWPGKPGWSLPIAKIGPMK
jgi:hypothetical protein